MQQERLKQQEAKQLERERYKLLNRLQHTLEIPMVVLGVIWLVLLVIELTRGLPPILQFANTVIWVIFILDFIIKFILAPRKTEFLKHNVLTTISLAVPALRVFRLARLFRVMRSVRAVRGLRLVKVVGSINRGMRSLGKTMQRRAFGYVLTITLVVIVAGAAGMFAFENEHGLYSYSEALWWTVMLLTSIGSDYFPVTAEGRVLCFLLAVYGFAVFGYFTATLATFFIDSDAENARGELAGSKQIKVLQHEIKELRTELQAVLKSAGNYKPPQEPPQL
ncbi:potassium channel family protein [Pontibacter sp. BT310]|uniref:Ion transporter n=1 Tax=Pontibacter populi TaxID=890055 RepID=A0ABS6XD72_9BACT|nr:MULTISPECIES: potassium channel family protein [Pontibacter]MBJ6119087.1 potassium channel family protein [Pontibacter sp. BT310]MBR0571515.1 potassium channel family protein [Microvirga sp. STS03]MBW3365941.1 ion transporter [Pontibacter populi]